MKICITGGRDFNDRIFLNETLDLVLKFRGPILVFVEGEAPGADILGKNWALSRGIAIRTYPAKWDDLTLKPCFVKERNGRKYNALAGFARNQEMIDKENLPHAPIELLVAFKGGKGTKDMCDRARRAGIEIEILETWDAAQLARLTA